VKELSIEAVLALMPEEERVQYSAITGQSLFYMGETDLKNKILAIVEEEGAQRAAYALKRIEGPAMIFLTSTAIEIDEEVLNRCGPDGGRGRARTPQQRRGAAAFGILSNADFTPDARPSEGTQ
jgi:hypothetical protein